MSLHLSFTGMGQQFRTELCHTQRDQPSHSLVYTFASIAKTSLSSISSLPEKPREYFSDKVQSRVSTRLCQSYGGVPSLLAIDAADEIRNLHHQNHNQKE